MVIISHTKLSLTSFYVTDTLARATHELACPNSTQVSYRIRGISSVGRALAWHARGHRFKSVILHFISLVAVTSYEAFLLGSTNPVPQILLDFDTFSAQKGSGRNSLSAISKQPKEIKTGSHG